MKLLVVHCSASPDDRNDQAEDIHNWHSQRGFDGIGYHYVITRNGDVQAGRPEYWHGAHAKGHNKGTLAVCLIGENNFSEFQMESLTKFCLDKMRQYPKIKILGHYELDSKKTCPNIDMDEFRKRF